MFNPNSIFISPSSLSDFDKCPQLYYYRNVYRSPKTGLKIQIVNPPLALGQTIHDVLDRFLQSGNKSSEELEKIYDWYWSQITGEKGGFFDKDKEKEFKERGGKMLSRFFNNNKLESSKRVKLPEFPKSDLGNDIILTGKIDYIEDQGDFYHIIDFKTGKLEEREDSKQLPIYALLVKGIFKNKKVRVSYWYLGISDNLKGQELPDLEKEKKILLQKGQIIKMARQTNSFRCVSGYDSCMFCRDFLKIVKGEAKMVAMDTYNRKQEIYVIPPKETIPSEEKNDLPF